MIIYLFCFLVRSWTCFIISAIFGLGFGCGFGVGYFLAGIGEGNMS